MDSLNFPNAMKLGWIITKYFSIEEIEKMSYTEFVYDLLSKMSEDDFGIFAERLIDLGKPNEESVADLVEKVIQVNILGIINMYNSHTGHR